MVNFVRWLEVLFKRASGQTGRSPQLGQRSLCPSLRHAGDMQSGSTPRVKRSSSGSSRSQANRISRLERLNLVVRSARPVQPVQEEALQKSSKSGLTDLDHLPVSRRLLMLPVRSTTLRPSSFSLVASTTIPYGEYVVATCEMALGGINMLRNSASPALDKPGLPRTCRLRGQCRGRTPLSSACETSETHQELIKLEAPAIPKSKLRKKTWPALPVSFEMAV